MHAVILNSCLSFSLITESDETDSLALLQIKDSITDDPFGVMASWNETVQFCHWRGVTCGRRHQRITGLNLESLNLTGSISPHVGNLSFLRVLNLQNNSFSHEIPPEISRLHRLQDLLLNNNSLGGEIPSNLSACSQLLQIDLGHNSLVGRIPEELGTLSKLRILVIRYNNIRGSVPYSFRNLSTLEVLSASSNYLNGSIPDIFSQLTKLTEIRFADNSLSGMIPPSIFNLSSLIRFSLQLNEIQGLGSCIKVEKLYMQGNFFQETIPLSLASLRGIQELNLSRNNLSGKIPEFLESFQLLQSLNLSDNNFEGMVPTKGVFTNATATSVRGNSNLCWGPLEFHLPKCKFKQPKKGGLSLTLKVIISIGCALLGGTFAFTFLYHCCVRRDIKDDCSSGSEKFLRLSYQSLLKATDGFSSSNLIGVGSFGSVYKGSLDQGETTIAVKVLNLVHPGASKSFSAECEALKNIRHRNLVKVISACSGVDYHGHDFKALIYEYMVNGSLDEWLHQAPTVGETNESPRSLTFSQRLNIAIDVAMALDYLHHQCETPIVHCDLKPSNVLLNDDMIGHVGDFGLVRFLLKLPDSCSGNQSSSLGVKGTIGYTPPEYGMGNEVWTQGDVYSYGILLLELFTRRRPTDEIFQGSVNLHNFVKTALPYQVEQIVDPVLVEERGEGIISTDNNLNGDSTRAFINIQESLIAILEVGVACSAELPRERLDIRDALAEMCRIRSKL
ncbi:hypothetical protein Pyn_29634 [Prunus yedoensis var. nudiflora]|uniref:non-specific serine/threonine protein kinase n=1 Tax=Prunus yedoensis var. nudiflora TaxID=2094558 RepID=A0A314YVM4_PRUYE|nr:hypothetical protein Pyn_29634 [Prunus yedoensis var. nudiflora]